MVYTASGTKLVSYTYDAWGNVSSLYHNNGASTAAKYNCFRYRGYFYDEETGLYYLNSRYYDPATGRFLNADVYVSTGQGLDGFNMYSYCNNNPILYVDRIGNLPEIEFDDTAYPQKFNEYLNKYYGYYWEQYDKIVAFNRDTEKEWQEYLATGEYVSYEEFEARKYMSICGTLPVEYYCTEFASFGEVYVTNLVYSVVFEKNNFPTTCSAVYVAASTTNNLFSDFHSDCIIYNRNSTDKYVAMLISLVCDSIDFGLGFAKGIAPPVGAGISTGIYYTKQLSKLILCGY